MGAGRPSDPPNLPPPVVTPSLRQQMANPSITVEKTLLPQVVHGAQQGASSQTQAPTSPRFHRKSFLSITIGEKPPVIPINRVPVFSRMPKLVDIRSAFRRIRLVGAYEIRWLDYKHVLIHLSNEQDFNRIWTKQQWFIANQKMRVFKWSPEFEAEKESPVVPVWISFPNLKAHLYEKSTLLLIAKIVGKPLFVDEATTKGSRPSVARVCVEYDCRKPPVEQIWIVIQNREIGAMTGGYSQKVEFPPMPDYCYHCCHVGHKNADCIVLGNKPKPPRSGKLQITSKEKASKPQSLRPDDMGKPTGLEEGGGMVLEKRKNLEKEKIMCPEEPAKTFQRWQLVNNEGISGAKDRQGKEIGSEDDPKDASIPISNRFHVISEEDDEAQIRTVK
ncbi:protein of unknown function DUF4283 - like 10 [Theobroma cacao]|nr:protein of unknown function DUF4283 - like 10 [Theobroma cacao]